MVINTALLTLLARSNPLIWEILHPHVPALGGPFGPQPEPLLTQDADLGGELNPQPLPPVAMALGARAGLEIARLAWTAQSLGVAFDIDDDWCPTYPHHPHIPWVVGGPGTPQPDPWFHAAYYVGLAAALASVTSRAPEATRSAGLETVLSRALDALGSVQGHLDQSRPVAVAG